MEALAYYDGKIGTPEELTVPFNDRVHFFGDGVYDATVGANGKVYLMQDHLDRFYTSAKALDIHIPMPKEELGRLLTDLLAKVDGTTHFVYWQVTRGIETRNHVYAEDLPGKLWVSIRQNHLNDPDVPIKLNTEEDDLVSFLIGCSFSFESALLDADIPVRQIEEGVNVPMYNTNIPCTPAGVFSGNMVVSMRPIPYAQVPAAVAITAGMPRVHGAPIQIGAPQAIGITDLAHPDYGDAVTIRPGEIPVFWPCGVTPQAVVMHSKPEFCITHAPGHMFVTDVKNTLLKL